LKVKGFFLRSDLTRRQRDRLLTALQSAAGLDRACELIAREAGISHEAVNPSAGIRRRGALHIQT
jgi:DNA-binding CsgD family transcriptional regulator